MTIRRYGKTKILGLNFRFGTSQAIPILRQNIANGNIKYSEHILEENERLDILAGKVYGDSSLYWILAACSDIGFVLQVPPGTLIKIPDINDVAKYV